MADVLVRRTGGGQVEHTKSDNSDSDDSNVGGFDERVASGAVAGADAARVRCAVVALDARCVRVAVGACSCALVCARCSVRSARSVLGSVLGVRSRRCALGVRSCE